MYKKTLISGLIIALAATYPIASNYHGKKLHEHIDQRVAALNEYLSNNLGLKSSIDAKLEESGIFSSHYVISIKNAEGKITPLFSQDIEHGPFPLSSLKKGHFLPVSYGNTLTLIRNQLTNEFFNMAKNEQPLVIKYTLGYDQQIKGEISLPLLQQITEKGEFYQYPYSIKFSTDKDFNDIHFQEAWDGVKILSNEDFQYKAGKFTSSTDIKKQDKNLSVQSKNNTENASINIGNIIQATFGPIDSQLSLDNDGNTADINEHFTIQNVTILDTNLGKLSLHTGLQHLDSDVLAELASSVTNLFVTLIQEGIKNGWKNDPRLVEHAITPYALQIGGTVVSLLDKNPLLTLGPITLTNTGGELDIDTRLGLSFPKTITGNSSEILLNAISDVDFSMSISKDWATQTLIDIASITAKKNKLPLPSKEDKEAITAIMADVEKALIDSQLMTAKEGKLFLTVKAKSAEKGQSITTAENATYNGKDYSVLDFIAVLTERANTADNLLKVNRIKERLDEVMYRFFQ